MLFNSSVFLVVYLPVALCLYWLFASHSQQAKVVSLGLMSIVFWCWSDVTYLPLFIGSICFNFFMAIKIDSAPPQSSIRKSWLWAAIVVDIFVLGFFKYANFISENLNLGYRHSLVLPTGISFFTFTQIAYLIDCFQRKVKEHNFPNFALFVSYFPHLIAGPIIHHAEIMPQFHTRLRPSDVHWALGLTFLAFGLAKKMGADVIAEQANITMYFDLAEKATIQTQPAWSCALAYALQIYLDFSAYSDMAVGISLLFGIRLPVNFLSPYKSESIIDFWRHWHMTLSRLLRDYVYVPLGGNRKGKVRRYINLTATMLIGGLWHGANWTFLVWGGLHGLFLMINHLWRAVAPRSLVFSQNKLLRLFKWGVTFLCVLVAWVFFRAHSLHGALNVLQGMFDYRFLGMPTGKEIFLDAFLCLVLFALKIMPNPYEMAAHWHPALTEHAQPIRTARIRWRPNLLWAIVIGGFAVVGTLRGDRIVQFLYFNF